MAKAPQEDTNNDLLKLVEEVAILKDRCDQLEELLRILAEPILETSLSEIFPTSKHLRAYELSNGERSTRDIGALIGVDQKTISTWWRNWETDQKIVEKFGKRGQFKKRYSLLDLMIRHGKKVIHPAINEEGGN